MLSLWNGLEAVYVVDGIGDEHALLLGLKGCGQVARTIWRWGVDEVARFDEEGRGGVLSCRGGRRGREE